MVDLVLGIAAAAGASTLYSLGIVLQAMDAREAPGEEHLRLALARGLVRRARWLAGTCLSILGFPLQVVALMLAPLVVVQPALAAGLLVLLIFGQRMLGEHAGKYEYISVLAITIGVIGAAIQVAPVVFVTQTVVPIVLAPLLLGESFAATPLGGVPLAASLALLVAGAAMLVRSPLLLALMAGERVSHPSGSGVRPPASS